MNHIVMYSGGHSSALTAIEVARQYGTDHLILMNHDINPSVEDADVKRFKNEVAAYLELPITYVNMPGWDRMDQFDVVIKKKAFKVGNVHDGPPANQMPAHRPRGHAHGDRKDAVLADAHVQRAGLQRPIRLHGHSNLRPSQLQHFDATHGSLLPRSLGA